MTSQQGFELLLSPFDHGRIHLRNRVQVTGHGTFNVDENGTPDEREAAYFGARAAGGAALLISGTNSVHPSSPPILGQYQNHHDRVIPGLARVAEAVHAHNALYLAQLGHMGQRAMKPQEVWSPSAYAVHSRHLNVIPHAMSKAEIGTVVDAFAAAAVRCIEAGLDGVEIAVGHGQLVNSFLSPITNKRIDEYGGSLKNRFRFISEIAQSVRDEIGDAGLVGFRINATDLMPGGLTESDWIEIATLLQDLKVGDYMNVSVDFTGSLIPTTYHPHGLYLAWAGRFKRVLEMPVFGVGRVVDPEEAEQALHNGDVDVVGMTRAHIADPDIIRKIERGERSRIRPCIGCLQGCVGEAWRGRNIKCIYNPITGREVTRSHNVIHNRRPKRNAMVIGAGPSGLEAARLLAAQGDVVEVFERNAQAGGHFYLYASQGGREEFRRSVNWLEAEARREGAVFHFNAEVSVDDIVKAQPDMLILATGGTRSTPQWGAGHSMTFERGLDLIPGISEEGILPTSQRITVVDDIYGRGLLTSIELSRRGHKVTLLETTETVAPEKEFNMVEDMLSELHRNHGVVLTNVMPDKISKESCGLHLKGKYKQHEAVWCSDYVLSTVTEPSVDVHSVESELKKKLPGLEIHIIGDANTVGRMENAIESAFIAVGNTRLTPLNTLSAN